MREKVTQSAAKAPLRYGRTADCRRANRRMVASTLPRFRARSQSCATAATSSRLLVGERYACLRARRFLTEEEDAKPPRCAPS